MLNSYKKKYNLFFYANIVVKEDVKFFILKTVKINYNTIKQIKIRKYINFLKNTKTLFLVINTRAIKINKYLVFFLCFITNKIKINLGTKLQINKELIKNETNDKKLRFLKLYYKYDICNIKLNYSNIITKQLEYEKLLYMNTFKTHKKKENKIKINVFYCFYNYKNYLSIKKCNKVGTNKLKINFSLFFKNINFEYFITYKIKPTSLKQTFLMNIVNYNLYKNMYGLYDFKNYQNYSDKLIQFNTFKNTSKIPTNFYSIFNYTYYNNFFPYFFSPFKKSFFKTILLNNRKTPLYINFYNYYLLSFLEIFLQNAVWLKINAQANKIIVPSVYKLLTEIYNKQKQDSLPLGKHFYLQEIIEIIYIALYNRDIQIISRWIKKIMEKIHLKKHKKFIKVIHNIFKNNLELLKITNIIGISMDIRGKLASAGNSKKRHYSFQVGSTALTSKNHDLSLHQINIRTTTGVLGLTILLSY